MTIGVDYVTPNRLSHSGNLMGPSLLRRSHMCRRALIRWLYHFISFPTLLSLFF
ncbi:hypothetical protein AMTRI_Chr08g207940 [Amborella trichopoda]